MSASNAWTASWDAGYISRILALVLEILWKLIGRNLSVTEGLPDVFHCVGISFVLMKTF